MATRKSIIGGHEIARKFIGTQEIKAEYCGDVLFWERAMGENVFILEWKDEIYFEVYGDGQVSLTVDDGYKLVRSIKKKITDFHYAKGGLHVTWIYFQKGVQFSFSFCKGSAKTHSVNVTRILSPLPENITEDIYPQEFASVTNFSMGGGRSGTTVPYLYEIPEDLFKYHRDYKYVNCAFESCTSLTSVPDGIFKDMKNLTYARFLFARSALKTIPEGLFHDCINLYDLWAAFYDAAISYIPKKMFATNVNIQSLDHCFSKSKIKSVPAGLLDFVIDSPTGTRWNFTGIFEKCEELIYADPNLFPYAFDNTYYRKISVLGMFAYCKNMTEAPRLWKKTEEGTIYTIFDNPDGFYTECTSLPWYGEIPSYYK